MLVCVVIALPNLNLSYISAAHRPWLVDRGGCCRHAVAHRGSQWPERLFAVIPNHRLDARVLRERILAELASDPALLEAPKGHIWVQEPSKQKSA